jgi:hypothetical protein
VDLLLVDVDGNVERLPGGGKPTGMPDTAGNKQENHDSQGSMGNLSARTKTQDFSQDKVVKAPLFQFSLDFKTPGPKTEHAPAGPTVHHEDGNAAGEVEPTAVGDLPPNRKTTIGPEYDDERRGSHGHVDDRTHTEQPSTKFFVTRVEDGDDTMPSPTSAAPFQMRQQLHTRVEKPKQDRRNMDRQPPKKTKDAPSVSKAIAILDWAWKQEVSGLESVKHREVQLLTEQLSSIQESCVTLSQELDIERDANSTLHDELDAAKLSLEDLWKKHAAAKKFNDGLQNDLVVRNQKNSSLEADIDSLKEQLETTRSELEGARKACDSRDAELDASRKQFDVLRLDTESRVKELERRISELERDLSTKVDLLEKSQQEVSRWQEKAENSEKIRQLIEAQMQLHQDLVSKEVLALNSKIEDLQNVRNELRTEEIIKMLQDINSRKLTSPQDMMEIENKIQGLAGRCVQSPAMSSATY